jgi:hypothetical protein
MESTIASCLGCQGRIEIRQGTTFCYACLFDTLSKESQELVDNSLYTRHFLPGIKQLKDGLGIGLNDSKFMCDWRYHQLRRLKPNSFPYPDTAYWLT